MALTAETIAKMFYPGEGEPPEWVMTALKVAMSHPLNPHTIDIDYQWACDELGVTTHPMKGSKKEPFVTYKHAIRCFLNHKLKYSKNEIAKVDNCHHTTVINSVTKAQELEKVQQIVKYLSHKYIINL